MIYFQKFTLSNGLRLLVHEDKSTPLVAVNTLYDVGSRDENPERTGFAHLFEHLMFGGSKHIKKFDEIVQYAGGDNNAFTSYDITNFYITLPSQNLETAFWLESDRMLALNINKKTLSTQQKVVVEEFKETTLDEPYGDVWHHLGPMLWEKHPYQTPIIGKKPEHIAQATLQDVKDFYRKYYCPNNAIIAVSGNINIAEVLQKVEKWFGEIPRGETPPRQLPLETPQTAQKRKTVAGNVPVPMIYMTFHSPERTSPIYAASDVLTDILSNGSSSRLYRRLLKEKRLFSEIDCYVLGLIDPSAIVIEGKPAEGVSLETAEAAIWDELEMLRNELISDEELQRHKNRVESQQAFSALGAMHKALNLSLYELLGNPDLINTEIEQYLSLTPAQLQTVAQSIFAAENACILHYLPKNEKVETNNK